MQKEQKGEKNYGVGIINNMKKSQKKLIASLSRKHKRGGSRSAFRRGKKLFPSLWGK